MACIQYMIVALNFLSKHPTHIMWLSQIFTSLQTWKKSFSCDKIPPSSLAEVYWVEKINNCVTTDGDLTILDMCTFSNWIYRVNSPFLPQPRGGVVFLLQWGRGEQSPPEWGSFWQSGLRGGGRNRRQKEDHLVSRTGEHFCLLPRVAVFVFHPRVGLGTAAAAGLQSTHGIVPISSKLSLCNLTEDDVIGSEFPHNEMLLARLLEMYASSKSGGRFLQTQQHILLL